jgi:hypothetical protein
MSIFLTVASKQNVSIDIGLIIFEGAFVVSGLLFNDLVNTQVAPNISKICEAHVSLTAADALAMDRVWDFQLSHDTYLTFQVITSVIVCLHAFNILSQLRRTITIGPSIIMMLSLKNDLFKFFTAFTLPIALFVAIGFFNTTEFTTDSLDPWNFFI